MIHFRNDIETYTLHLIHLSSYLSSFLISFYLYIFLPFHVAKVYLSILTLKPIVIPFIEYIYLSILLSCLSFHLYLYHSAYLSFYLSFYHSVYLSFYHSIYLYLSCIYLISILYLSCIYLLSILYLSYMDLLSILYQSIFLSIYLSILLNAYLFQHWKLIPFIPFNNIDIYLSLNTYIYMSFYLPYVYLCIYLISILYLSCIYLISIFYLSLSIYYNLTLKTYTLYYIHPSILSIYLSFYLF